MAACTNMPTVSIFRAHVFFFFGFPGATFSIEARKDVWICMALSTCMRSGKRCPRISKPAYLCASSLFFFF